MALTKSQQKQMLSLIQTRIFSPKALGLENFQPNPALIFCLITEIIYGICLIVKCIEYFSSFDLIKIGY